MNTENEIQEMSVKLNRLLSKELSTAEREKLQRMMLALDRIEALGFFARWAFYGLLTAGAILANWERIIGWWRGL